MKMKLCGWAGCQAIVKDSYYCPEHKAKADAHRKATAFQTATRYANYNTPEWRKASGEYMRRIGHCEKCGSKEHLQVHHIIPARYAPQLFMDSSNWQVLCRACHQNETAREIAARRKRKN